MDNAELVGLTLDRLIDHFKLSPESFDFSGGVTHPTVLWRPKVQLDDLNNHSIRDPNNAHAVIVRWNPHFSQVVCYVFLVAPEYPLNAIDKADSTISSQRYFESWRSNYRKLLKLKRLIEEREAYRANMAYLRKLSSIFPDAVDSHIR